jgi:hypothetical protein
LIESINYISIEVDFVFVLLDCFVDVKLLYKPSQIRQVFSLKYGHLKSFFQNVISNGVHSE